jgi:hypothetical protein
MAFRSSLPTVARVREASVPEVWVGTISWPTEQVAQRPRRCRDGRVLGNVERTEGSDAIKVRTQPTALPGDALGTGKGGRDDAARWDDEEENDVA